MIKALPGEFLGGPYLVALGVVFLITMGREG